MDFHIILKSLITLREQFAVRAVKNNATNLLAKQEKTFQKNIFFQML